MPTYTMQHKESGETQTLVLTLSEREEFLEKNPEWTQTLSVPRIVREAKGALAKSPDSWKDHLKQIKKGSGMTSKVHV